MNSLSVNGGKSNGTSYSSRKLPSERGLLTEEISLSESPSGKHRQEMSTQTCQFREKMLEKMLDLDKCMQNKDNMIKNHSMPRATSRSLLARDAPASDTFPITYLPEQEQGLLDTYACKCFTSITYNNITEYLRVLYSQALNAYSFLLHN